MCLLFLNYRHFLLEYLVCASVEERGDGIMMFVGELVYYGWNLNYSDSVGVG